MPDSAGPSIVRGIFARTVLLAGCASVVLLVACAAGEEDGSPESSTPLPEGAITVETRGAIEGQDGRTLLITIAAEGGQDVARACVGIDSDEFTLPPIPLTDMPSGDDPCAKVTGTTVFPEGDYMLTAGIYSPPSVNAEKFEIRYVTVVAGEEVAVALSGGGLSR